MKDEVERLLRYLRRKEKLWQVLYWLAIAAGLIAAAMLFRDLFRR